MPSITPNLRLSITNRETNKPFLNWRLGIDGPDDSNMIKLDKAWGDMKTMVDGAMAAVGHAYTAATAADMTDHDKSYVYVGSETGYTNGNWYYWNEDQSAWVSGGVYNATALQTDDTLTLEGEAADAKATGEMIVINGTSSNGTRINITTTNEDIVIPTMDDVDDLKTQLKTEQDGAFILTETIQGSYNSTGAVVENANRIRNAGFLPVAKGQAIHFVPGTDTAQVLYGTFNIEKVFVSDSPWITAETTIVIPNDGYIIAVFAKADKTTAITPSDFDATFEIYTKWKVSDFENAESIENTNNEIENFVKNVFGTYDVSTMQGVTKLGGYSFGVGSTVNSVSGSPSASYDSYYFYTDEDKALYFDSNAPSTPAYIALTVGYNPSKSWITAGGNQLQMACENASRKRKSENNLPVSSSPANVSNAIVIITVNVDTTTNITINNRLQLQDDVLLSNSQIEQVIDNIPDEKTPKLRYKAVSEWADEYSNEQIDIFIPVAYGYIRYAFGHSIKADINANSWRIFRAITTDEDLTDRFPVTTYGEWEMALKLENGTDFIGGILHGDEVLNNIKFFVDGGEVDITTLTTLTEFKELRIVENTLLYNPDVENENVAKHSKEYIFTSDGLTLNQRVYWLMSKTLTTSYAAMFPLIRGNDTVSELQVTADYYDNNDYETYDVSVGGVSGYPFTWHSNVSKAHFWSDESGIFASAEMLSQPSLTGGKMSFVQNTVNQYNKLYYSICGIGATYTTQANERWDWSAKYNIDAVNVM